MTYLLLIIIALLIYIAFFTPKKREQRDIRRVQKLFNTKLPIPKQFDVNDPRNKTHPEETVTYRDGLASRKLAMLLEDAEHRTSKDLVKSK